MDSPSRREQVFSPAKQEQPVKPYSRGFSQLVLACYMEANRFLCKWSRIHRVLHCHHGRVSFSGVENEILAVRRDAGRTLGPKGLDLTEPSANFSPKEAVGRILLG